MQTEASVEIDRPIEEVFELTNRDVAAWSIVVVEDELLEDHGGLGNRFRSVTVDRGKRMVFEGVVSRWEPPYASAVDMTGRQFDIHAEYTFEDLGNGRTIVTQRSFVQGKRLFAVVFKLIGWMMKKQGCEAVQTELQSLKHYCETKPVPASAE